MWDELKNLHWDVPEYQDAAPEATLIRLSLLQKISVTYSWTELPKFKEYILSALSIFQSVVQIRKRDSLITSAKFRLATHPKSHSHVYSSSHKNPPYTLMPYILVQFTTHNT